MKSEIVEKKDMLRALGLIAFLTAIIGGIITYQVNKEPDYQKSIREASKATYQLKFANCMGNTLCQNRVLVNYERDKAIRLLQD